MADTMQTAVEVLARALFDMKNTANIFGPWDADVSNIIRTPFRAKATALLAEIAPLIRADERDSDLILDAYKAILVLHRILDKSGLDAGAKVANQIADRIVAAHPEVIGRAAMRQRGNE